MARGMTPQKKSYTVYFASELSGLNHLIGNAYIVEAIYAYSHGKYLCVLPQNIDRPRGAPRAARDADIQALLSCDLGLFSSDGPELDPETTAKFMFAKFADIPSVILRGDPGKPGDAKDRRPGRMTRFYPRTTTIAIDSLGLYNTALHPRLRASARKKLDEVVRLAGQHSSAGAQAICEQVAAACVRAFDRMIVTEPALPKHLREEVYQWLALMPDFHGKPKELRRKLEHILEHKVEHDLL